MDAIKNFEWWHNAVFGNKPNRDAIPSEVLETYLAALRIEAYDNKTRVRVLSH